MTFAVGTWRVVDFEYVLESCPSGYAATTAKDGCVVCPAGKYSLREGVSHECLACPAGGDCIAGGDVVTFAAGNWSVVESVWRLQSCPPGYAPNDAGDGCVVCPAGKYSLQTGVNHECLPCPAGGDCLAGGDVVTFALGGWKVDNYEWRLKDCPIGHELTTSVDADECAFRG